MTYSRQPNRRASKTRIQSGTLQKFPTGIAGLDAITRGGFPEGRATLLLGGPGSGKTVLGLQTLVHGAREHGEPGIFVAFEESSARIVANAASFGWDLPKLQKKKLLFIDAMPAPELVRSGGFDLLGLMAALKNRAQAMGARRIVFDAIDVVMSLLDDPQAERRELYRLHQWLMEEGMTALLTVKSLDRQTIHNRHEDLLQFMVDCSVMLRHEIVEGISQRNLRIVKYRGSSVVENESAFTIGPGGIEVAGAVVPDAVERKASTERVSTGVESFDRMLGGGYFRGASILITGAPGTAKSTLCGSFAEAACRRGEHTLFLSFDSDPEEIVRNLASVGIRLEPFRRKGLLRMASARAGEGSAEQHFMRLKALGQQHQVRNLVVDPVSALAKQGNEQTSFGVVERLNNWVKSEGITAVYSSLLGSNRPETEGTPIQISTIADTWIHLSFDIRAGERNRALSIIKSRGTAHSNQVRELVLSGEGLDIREVFTAGGDVLMGTLRWEREEQLREEKRQRERRSRLDADRLAAEEAELASRIKALEKELQYKRSHRESLQAEEEVLQKQEKHWHASVEELRGGDSPKRRNRRK